MSINLIKEAKDNINFIINQTNDSNIINNLTIVKNKLITFINENSNNNINNHINNNINNHINNHINYQNNFDDCDEEEQEIIRKEVKSEFLNIKNSPKLFNFEDNITPQIPLKPNFQNFSYNQNNNISTNFYHTQYHLTPEEKKIAHTDFYA